MSVVEEDVGLEPVVVEVPRKRRTSRRLQLILRALQSIRDGDFSVNLPSDWIGLHGKIADTFNQTVLANRRLAEELERVGHSVGREGQTRQRVSSGIRLGSWGRDGDLSSTR